MAFGAMTSLSNTSAFTRPALPTLPGIGGWWTEPTTGVRILQITAPSSGDDSVIGYSYWPSMNSDNTRFFLILDKTPAAPNNLVMWNFNPTTEVLGSSEDFCPASEGPSLTGATAFWSWTEPDVCYGVDVNSNTVLRKMQITGAGTRTWTTLKTFAFGVTQMTMSQNNRFFGFTKVGTSTYVVWDRTNDITYQHTFTNLDEGYVDLSGTYAVVAGDNQANSKRWDFVNDVLEAWPNGPQPVHGAIGNLKHFANKAAVGPGTYNLNVTPITYVDDFNATWTAPDKHASWLNVDDLSWAYLTTYATSASPWNAYWHEIIRVKTDGSGQWRRLAHSRSDLPTDWYRSGLGGNISRDSRWFIYCTDWDQTGPLTAVSGTERFRYCMMLKVPTEAEFAAGDYGSGSSPLFRGA